MGTPLREQLDHPHEDADRSCEGCYGSGWLTALVDNIFTLQEAGVSDPTDFVMKCGECDVFSDDDEAASAARESGMVISDNLVVVYTEAQKNFLKDVEPVDDPALFLIHQIGGYLESLKGQVPQILDVSCDGDHKSAEIIVDVWTDEGLAQMVISTSGIRWLDDE